MTLNTEPRFRINAKQTAKNFYQLDVTAEYKSEYVEVSVDPNDQGNTVRSHLGLRALSILQETEKVFRKDGRKIIGDKE
jgi:hypothetical protein